MNWKPGASGVPTHPKCAVGGSGGSGGVMVASVVDVVVVAGGGGGISKPYPTP